MIALIAGLVLVLALAALAIWGDLGEPSVADDDVAVVEDAPDGEITRDEFNTALEQAAFNLNLREVPNENNAQYDQVKQAALSNLVQTRWIRGEAAERGIEVADRDIDRQLEQIKQTQLGGQQGYERFLKTSPYDEDDVRNVAEIGVLSTRIQEETVPTTAPEVSQEDIELTYEAGIDQYVEPASRDVRQILNPKREEVEQAKQLLERNDSPQSWKQVADRFSTDDATRTQGGLRRDVVQGQSEPTLDQEIFTAELNELVGPFKGQGGWYLIQVVGESPERVTPLEEVSDQIRQQIQQGEQQAASSAFQADFVDKWRSRTFCAEAYVAELCANNPPPPDNCLSDDPSERKDADPAALTQGCEAPVASRPVVDPGNAYVSPGAQPNARYQGVQRPTPPGSSTTLPPGALPIGPEGAPPVPPG